MTAQANLQTAGVGTNPAQILATQGQPTYLISSGTITATGALSALSAMPYTPTGVAQVWVAAAGIGGITGLYFARWTGTTALQLYTDAAGTVTPTGLTPGAYAGTTALATLASINIPPGALGPNGAINLTMDCSFISSGGNKFFSITFNNTQITAANTSAGIGVRYEGRISNRGVTTQQIGGDNSFLATGNFGALTMFTVNTEQASTLAIKCQLAAATDWLGIENFTATLAYGA